MSTSHTEMPGFKSWFHSNFQLSTYASSVATDDDSSSWLSVMYIISALSSQLLSHNGQFWVFGQFTSGCKSAPLPSTSVKLISKNTF